MKSKEIKKNPKGKHKTYQLNEKEITRIWQINLLISSKPLDFLVYFLSIRSKAGKKSGEMKQQVFLGCGKC